MRNEQAAGAAAWEREAESASSPGPARERALRDWLDAAAGVPPGAVLEPLAGDASFRRYLRLRAGEDGNATTFVVMDAPPAHGEDVSTFVRVANLLRDAGVNVPAVHAADLARGFLLLGDLGSVTYLDRLDAATAPALYRDALVALVRMQCRVSASAVPPYDEAELRAELELFPDWFLGRHLGQAPSPEERRVLDDTFALLVDAALAQRPRVFVHRDYHARNLMVCEGGNPGVLDFQDAVAGPVTYDLVSLLRDAYIAWPREQVLRWVDEYVDLAAAAGLLPLPQAVESRAWRAGFRRDLDLVGVQRHLKVAGIFARLYYRDGKDAYLGDIPLTLRYLLDTVARHEELAPLARLLARRDLERHASAPLPTMSSSPTLSSPP